MSVVSKFMKRTWLHLKTPCITRRKHDKLIANERQVKIMKLSMFVPTVTKKAPKQNRLSISQLYAASILNRILDTMISQKSALFLKKSQCLMIAHLLKMKTGQTVDFNCLSSFHKENLIAFQPIAESPGARTQDAWIKSPVLYQLS